MLVTKQLTVAISIWNKFTSAISRSTKGNNIDIQFKSLGSVFCITSVDVEKYYSAVFLPMEALWCPCKNNHSKKKKYSAFTEHIFLVAKV